MSGKDLGTDLPENLPEFLNQLEDHHPTVNSQLCMLSAPTDSSKNAYALTIPFNCMNPGARWAHTAPVDPQRIQLQRRANVRLSPTHSCTVIIFAMHTRHTFFFLAREHGQVHLVLLWCRVRLVSLVAQKFIAAAIDDALQIHKRKKMAPVSRLKEQGYTAADKHRLVLETEDLAEALLQARFCRTPAIQSFCQRVHTINGCTQSSCVPSCSLWGSSFFCLFIEFLWCPHVLICAVWLQCQATTLLHNNGQAGWTSREISSGW